MLLLGVYACILIFMVIYCVVKCTVRVKIGKPPVDILFVAYKYSCLIRKSNFRFLEKSAFSLNTHKLIKCCYFSAKDKQIEFAQGVVLSEKGVIPENKFFSEAKRLGLNFFTTPSISHSVYMEFPVFLSFSLTKLFAVIIGYTTIRRFSEVNNLCAYPVIEVHSLKSIIIFVPLVRQDSFVVHEAEKITFGKSYTSLIELNNSSFTTDNSFDESSSKSSKHKFYKRITKG